MDNNCVCENCEFREVVFANLDDTSIQELCNNKTEKSYYKGQIITREGDQIGDFKYLKSGLVKIYRTSTKGKEQIVTITRPFEFISNSGIFAEERYNYSVSALEDSVVCIVNMGFMKQLSLKNGAFIMNLLSRVSKINEKIITQSLDIRQKNLVGKVAYVLLYFAGEIYNTRIFDIPVSRQEIADYIGMSTANVIRTLSDFKRERIIRISGKTIEITDIKRLEIMSKIG